MAIHIEEPTLFENILHWGLMLGAVFQLICILSVISLPKTEQELDPPEETTASNKGPVYSSPQQSSKRSHKKEKKKNR